MSDRPTPETDAAWKEGNAIREWTCRKMERERDEARELVCAWESRWEAEVEFACRVSIKRDEAREQVKELIYIAERAIALAEIDFENDKFGVVSELRYGLEKIMEAAK